MGNQATGFITIVGRPNVGKSTLLNGLLGEKVAIVSPKPQTTRDRIRGIRTDATSQLVFIDTPGIHKPLKALNRAMVEAAVSTLAEVDVVVLVISAPEQLKSISPDAPADGSGQSVPPADAHVLEFVREAAKPAVLVINKTDKLSDKRLLLPIMELWQRAHPFTSLVPCSALLKEGFERLLGELVPLVPVGPKHYDDDIYTDRSLRFLAAETIREKLFFNTEQEIPYSLVVEIERFERRRALTVIEALIHVERPGQKAVVIGKGGVMLKRIGTAARADLEDLIGHQVLLNLHVRIERNWSTRKTMLRRFGYLE